MRETRRGAMFGLLAAASFGVGAPLAKLLGTRVPPLMLAGLLYGGAGLALSLVGALESLGRMATGRAPRGEAPLGRRDLPALGAVTVLGGMVGPWLMLFGLARVSATAGALLLNLEGPLTALCAVALLGEHLGRRGWMATAPVFAGAALLAIGGGAVGRVTPIGAAALAGACLAWAIDNNLTQRLALRDPRAVVRTKTLGAGTALLVLARAFGEHLPAARLLGAALSLGAVSYGASVLLDAYALRLLGAAREAAYFAMAPFVGALVGAAVFREPVSWAELGAGALMLGGVSALLRERHAHPHTHAPIEHEHAHVHDLHHTHVHTDAAGPPGQAGQIEGAHTHLHRHEAITHDHPHTSDAHHRHRH
ncbi:MAG TPA: EamA family transporter [Polyangia bacterium]|nr:EamA family transporter [Polyangia bacterium]